MNNNYFFYNSFLNNARFLEVSVESAGTAINNLFAYNKLINCGQTAIFHNKIDGNYINTNNTSILNNVIIETSNLYTPAKDMFSYDDPTLSEIVILRNNIIWLTTGRNLVSNNVDTNKMIHTNNIYTIRNGILGINLDKSEKSFFNNIRIFTDTIGSPENWDFRLPSNSIGINFGAHLGFTRDYIGNPIKDQPDVGIYEYQFTDTLTKLKAIATVDSIQCYGGNGIIHMSATGGLPPYLGTGSYSRTSGIYQFVVSDALGTKDTIMIQLTQPDSIRISAGYGIITSYNATTTIYVTANGGKPPYSYQLNNGLYQNSNMFSNLTAGVYKVSVKDANGCTNSEIVNLNITSITPNPDKKLIISVAPNPSSTSFTVNTLKYKGSFVTMNLNVYNAYGQLVYSAQGRSNVAYTFGNNFITGNYVLVAVVDGTVQAVKLLKL